MTFRFGTEQTFNDIQGRECYLIQEKTPQELVDKYAGLLNHSDICL